MKFSQAHPGIPKVGLSRSEIKSQVKTMKVKHLMLEDCICEMDPWGDNLYPLSIDPPLVLGHELNRI